MATLQKRKNGTWEIQFRNEHRERKTITLSAKYQKGFAQDFQKAVKVLIDKKINDDPTQHPRTKAFIESAPLEIQVKLDRHGLHRLQVKYSVQMLWDTFFDKHPDMGESTRKTYIHTKERFFLFFEPHESLDDLTQDRMIEWKCSLLKKEGYAQATVAGTLDKMRAVLNWAKKKPQEWITENPLDGVWGSYSNPDNEVNVTRREYRLLLDACPDQEWRVIIALARMGGLHPNEIMTLRWSDIDWKKHRFQVRNAKLKQIERLYKRQVPLFKPIAVELKKLRSLPGNEDQEHVINRFANREQFNLVQPFDQIAKNAGLGKIDRPFDNMRASRATEIYDKYGEFKETRWLGHSRRVALKSYLMMRDVDFAKAVGKKKVVRPTDKAVADLAPAVEPGGADAITAKITGEGKEIQ